MIYVQLIIMASNKVDRVMKGKHFSDGERLYLTELIKSNKDIEAKGYDAVVLSRKAKAWVEVVRCFKCRYPESAVDEKNLQGVWKRMKIKCKSDVDKMRKEGRMTGGGQVEEQMDVVTEQVTAVLGDSILPLENKFDDDCREQAAAVKRKN